MFNLLPLKAFYSSNENVSEIFFQPVLREAISYKRMSGYFSANVLANYGNSLVEFAKNNGRVQLIISHEVSLDDFNEMKRGYELRYSIQKELLNLLDTPQEDDVLDGISNLAYWIALGTLNIKIAFKQKGILHSKYGIFEDSVGNIIVFTGSNNETNAGFNVNYEDFSIACSWLADSNGFYTAGIRDTVEKFDQIWSNRLPELDVREIPEIVKEEILKYNRGYFTMPNNKLRDYDLTLIYKDNQIQLLFNIDEETVESFFYSGLYKIRIKKFVKEILPNKQGLIFKYAGVTDYNMISVPLEKLCQQLHLKLKIDDSISEFLRNKNLHIQERIKVGLNIKAQSSTVRDYFEKFKNIVNQEFTRILRDKQMWDAFFMHSMKRSANFSVPGSGKTSSALAVFAYLKKNDNYQNIIVIGPKNSFESWKIEFEACFGDKLALKCFDCHDQNIGNVNEKRTCLKYEHLKYNLFLFNYESLAAYIPEIDKILRQNKTLLVYDEVHRVKRIGGEWARSACDVAKNSTYTIVMTGTPIPNSYEDIYNFLNILFPDDYRNFFGFNHWSLANPSENTKLEINDRLKPFYCRTSKYDLGVPAPNEDKEIISLATPLENQIFTILRKAYRENPLALLIRILQLESNPKMLAQAIDTPDNIALFSRVFDIDEKNIEKMDFKDFSRDMDSLLVQIGDFSSKRNQCVKLIQELVSTNKNVIVWCIFKQSMNDIFKAVLDLGISADIINGAVLQEDRVKIINEFKQGKIKVLITNPHTLAESVSLHSVCHDAIYFEYSFNLVHLLQSKDRIHRLGLPETQYTQYWYLKNRYDIEGDFYSLDQKIYQRLKDKEQIMLEAIDQQSIESVTTSQEDLNLILGDLIGTDN